ncbi:glycosyltransferase family 10 [Loktanella sp. TSTF-M6]|uniref:Glycosyltransferase family 10 n=1 Tax=Loktanella gaetbuli TaxID=2881335 RepID=A0ABS8BY40_9RHOB|nr:glycosyltransferase family 10 [Loktanella gaetbuli]MCB5200642.1 glycosyltransferase family 10 [Loktanella gaetbuli]
MKIAYLLPDNALKFVRYFQPYLTPSGQPRWRDAEFVVNPDGGHFDGVVVHQSVSALSRSYRLTCPPGRTLICLKEPPDITFLPRGYLAQFASVICHDTRVRHPGRRLEPGAHHWFVEVPHDDIEPTGFTDKQRLISAVVSAKTDTPGHRQRLALMHRLKAHFGDRLDWWGRGINDLTAPKITALRDHKYHICLENGAWPGYWTEKIIDAYVANCVPVYWGAPDIGRSFDPATILGIDIADPQGCIDRIETAIANDMYARVQEGLARARRQILTTYHPYQIYTDRLAALPATPAREITIAPQTDFAYAPQDRIAHRIWRWRNRHRI